MRLQPLKAGPRLASTARNDSNGQCARKRLLVISASQPDRLILMQRIQSSAIKIAPESLNAHHDHR
eukprot:1180791-Prorocentrum_minimum.AAC.3